LSTRHLARHATKIAALLAALTASLLTGCGPLGPIPGGALDGQEHSGAPPDWRSLADVDQIQLETRPSDPYSVNTWMGVYRGRPYVPTSMILGADDPTDRQWVKNVLEDPNVRVRVEGVVYPLRAVRVKDDVELAAVRALLLEKYEVEADEHVEQGWIFRLDPR
jgi:hypothetical protein